MFIINTALSVMKKGKAADVFELTVENILYGEDELLYIIHKMIVAISREGHIPDLLTLLLIPFWFQYIRHYRFYNFTDYWNNSDTSVICNMQFGTFIFEYRR
jgi:hypothetical protein